MGMKKELAEVALAVIVALAAYQTAALLLGTNVPVTSVVTGSMEHSVDFDQWWSMSETEYSKFNITREDFLSFPYKKGLYVGDIVVVKKSDGIKKGDVIVYHPYEGCFDNVPPKATIIHRVVSTNPLVTKGDNNDNPDTLNRRIDGKSCILSIEGKAIATLPLLGYPRTILFKIIGI
ncbi:MAG: S26 family signal peptidase [Candidatus Aenigmarchaeota archaeon]|nr:S26 family signal peptidase [Candidatus Aenigmarchaeota archaeon]